MTITSGYFYTFFEVDGWKPREGAVDLFPGCLPSSMYEEWSMHKYSRHISYIEGKEVLVGLPEQLLEQRAHERFSGF